MQDQGEVDAARSCWEESLTLAELIPNAPFVTGAPSVLVQHIWLRGDYTEAMALNERSMTFARGTGDRRRMASALNSQGWIDYKTGNLVAAKQTWEEYLALADTTEERQFHIISLLGLGAVAGSEGCFADARQCQTAALALARAQGGQRLVAATLSNMSLSAVHEEDCSLARHGALASTVYAMRPKSMSPRICAPWSCSGRAGRATRGCAMPQAMFCQH